jgi:hypothetical protein
MALGTSWDDYEDYLVERDEGIIFDLGLASSWKKELKSMNNKHKVGRNEDGLSFHILTSSS